MWQNSNNYQNCHHYYYHHHHHSSSTLPILSLPLPLLSKIFVAIFTDIKIIDIIITITYRAMTRWTTSKTLTRKVQLWRALLLLTDIRILRRTWTIVQLPQLNSICSEDGRLHFTANVTTTELCWRRYVVSTITVNIRLEYRLEIYNTSWQVMCVIYSSPNFSCSTSLANGIKHQTTNYNFADI